MKELLRMQFLRADDESRGEDKHQDEDNHRHCTYSRPIAQVDIIEQTSVMKFARSVCGLHSDGDGSGNKSVEKRPRNVHE